MQCGKIGRSGQTRERKNQSGGGSVRWSRGRRCERRNCRRTRTCRAGKCDRPVRRPGNRDRSHGGWSVDAPGVQALPAYEETAELKFRMGAIYKVGKWGTCLVL